MASEPWSQAREMSSHRPRGTWSEARCDPCALLRQLLEAIEQGGGERRRRRQAERLKPYVAAQVDVLPESFTLGDKKSYRGFYNRPLSPDLSYQCFVLASLKEPVDQVCLSHLGSQHPGSRPCQAPWDPRPRAAPETPDLH